MKESMQLVLRRWRCAEPPNFLSGFVSSNAATNLPIPTGSNRSTTIGVGLLLAVVGFGIVAALLLIEIGFRL